MFFHLLTIVLLILKAMGYLTISWWVVFAPSVIAITIALAYIAICTWSRT